MDYMPAKNRVLRHIMVADHILTMTYPLVNDPKLLKLVIKNIYNALNETLSLLYYYDTKKKTEESYLSKIFKSKHIMQKYGISTGYIKFLNEIHEVMYNQENSEIEFVRKDKFVFASKDYDLNIISTDRMKDYLAKAKLFVNQVLGVMQNERIADVC